MVRRYSLRNEKGELVETPQDILERAARTVAQAENNFRDGITPQEVENRFKELLLDFRMVPNGRTLANAGTEGGQLANCFVLPLEDELGKTGDGIFSILRKAVLVLQSGGGVGFSFGRIRPKGDVAGRGKATGAVSFLKVFDTAFWVIGQGGGRRSACMAVLPVHHPDIHEFIRCKEKEGVIEHFNISVGITDAFMEAVIEDKPFDLVNPRDGKVWETVQARDLLDEIVEFAHHNGEPGVLFIDAANRDNPVPQQYTLEATNPCGEQWLGPYENCCMASVNLAEHVMDKKKQKKGDLFGRQVDWEKLRETVEWTVRWLDDVVEANKYVPAVPELQEAAHRNRRIGVSIMGLADLFYKVGIRYGSKEAVELAGQVMEFIWYVSMETSIQLATERGAFPGIQGSRFDLNQDENEFDSFVIPKPISSYKLDFDRPKLDWKKLVEQIKQNGIRNSCQTTIQPTGAIATIAGLEGYGCEPVFALSYVMKTHEGAKSDDGEEWAELYYESKAFAQVLQKAGLKKKEREEIFEIVRAKGSCQGVEKVPENVRDIFVVSADIKVQEHVKMQAAMQAFVDNAISKTINFPAETTSDQVKQAYIDGWKKGLKGMTVYVTGSRETVVLETGDTKEKQKKEALKVKENLANEVLDVEFTKTKKHGQHEPFAVNGNGYVGKPLKKVRHEQNNCPECGATLVMSEGCVTCPQCAYTLCTI
jgi:ribonucleoside-diphosphate reductase alpha chain